MLPSTPRRCAGEPEPVIAGPAVRTTTITAWMTLVAESVKDRRDSLTQLDAAIGDGDHGVNMDRGFDAGGKALAAQDGSVPPRQLPPPGGHTPHARGEAPPVRGPERCGGAGGDRAPTRGRRRAGGGAARWAMRTSSTARSS